VESILVLNARYAWIALLLLALVRAVLDELLDDYELSPDLERNALLARQQSSVREAILSSQEGFNVESYLQTGGSGQSEITTVCR
jgi:hypothetical protein